MTIEDPIPVVVVPPPEPATETPPSPEETPPPPAPSAQEPPASESGSELVAQLQVLQELVRQNLELAVQRVNQLASQVQAQSRLLETQITTVDSVLQAMKDGAELFQQIVSERDAELEKVGKATLALTVLEQRLAASAAIFQAAAEKAKHS